MEIFRTDELFIYLIKLFSTLSRSEIISFSEVMTKGALMNIVDPDGKETIASIGGSYEFPNISEVHQYIDSLVGDAS